MARAKNGGPREREELVNTYLPMIASVAYAYRRSSGLGRDELTQEGVVGLLRALERYEPQRGVPFWGYAAWWVRQAMQQVVSELSRPVVLSDRALRQLARIKDAQRRFGQTRRREATAAELSAMVGLQTSQVEKLLCTDRTARGLDEPTGGEAGDGATVGELLADPPAHEAYERVPQQLLASQIPRLLGHLSDRERTVICARYGLDCREETLREIAPRLGVSAERVRQIEQDSLAKLYAAIAPDQPPDRRDAPRSQPGAMHRREPRQISPDVADPGKRRRSRPSSARTTYAELLDHLVPAIERCRREAQRRLEELARRRVAMTPIQRATAHEALRAEAVAIRNELARLELVSSVATKLLRPLPAQATTRVSPDPCANGSPTA